MQYKKLVIYAYKKRSQEGKMMYLFSANSYYEAIKRKKYLDKIAEIQRKQKLIIKQHKKLIAKEKGELIEEIQTNENGIYQIRIPENTDIKTEIQKLNYKNFHSELTPYQNISYSDITFSTYNKERLR